MADHRWRKGEGQMGAESVRVVNSLLAIVGLLLLMPFARYLSKLSQPVLDRSSTPAKLQSLEQSAAEESRRAS